ncbi:MAG: hypothetical protein F6J97_22575 [Leptolyngbya sp. SIO4C1]|nr:hypothetical protein [Leptolyngbya sp. SIO4C1]
MTEPLTPSSPPASLWQLKPWWCQPWSILLTGIAVPTLSWVVLHRLWLSLPIALGVLLWWFLFLYLVPRQYAAMVQRNHS